MFNIQQLFDVFEPIFRGYGVVWNFMNTPMYEAYHDLSTFMEFNGVNIFAVFNNWILDMVANVTNFDEWLNQYTVLNFSFSIGFPFLCIVTVIGWFGDKIGL